MDTRVEEQARRLESILPMILRTIYPPREDDPFAELPLMQLRVIRSLADGPKSTSELAEELKMTLSRLTHLISRLEAHDLVERTVDAADRRIKHIALTEKGARQMQTHRALRSGRAATVLATLSEEDREMLMASLEKLACQAKSLDLVASIKHEAETVR